MSKILDKLHFFTEHEFNFLGIDLSACKVRSLDCTSRSRRLLGSNPAKCLLAQLVDGNTCEETCNPLEEGQSQETEKQCADTHQDESRKQKVHESDCCQNDCNSVADEFGHFVYPVDVTMSLL